MEPRFKGLTGLAGFFTGLQSKLKDTNAVIYSLAGQEE
jgi:hypothetical protein